MIYIIVTEGWIRKNLLESEWSKDLIRYVKNYSKKHQVVLLIEDEIISEASKLQDIEGAISQETPSFIMTFQETINSSNRYPVLENNPRSTTMFILILASKSESLSSRLSVPIEYLISLARVNSRPKCLIIQLVKEDPVGYHESLEDLWKKQLLDVTFVEIVEKGEEHHSEAFLHYLNPFKKVYAKQNFSSDSQWFPNKAHNLYGSEIKSVILKSELLDSVPMLKTLSKVMNFTSNSVKVNESQYGTFSCHKKECEGKIAELVENKVNFDATLEFSLGSNCSKPPYLKHRAIMMGSINALVPRIVVQRVQLAIAWEAFYSLMIIITFLTVLQIMPSNCKFEKRFWQPMNLLKIILGMSVENPKRLKDKIIFGSVILACVILTGYLFTILTEFSLFVGAELKIHSMENLDRSNLIPIFNRDVHRLTEGIDIIHFQYLRKKAQFYTKNYTPLMCLKDAVTHKNISCILLLSKAKFWIQKMKLSTDEIKIVDQPIVYGMYNWISEPGSVYFDQLNQIIQRLVENGVMDSWDLYGHKEMIGNEINFEESEDPLKLRYLLISTIVSGYLLSLIAFIGEAVVYYIWKGDG